MPAIRLSKSRTIAAAAAGGLVLLAFAVRAGGPVHALDLRILALTAVPDSGLLWQAALRVTALGAAPAMLAVMAVTSLLLARGGEGRLVPAQWAGYIAARVVTDGLKLIMARQRPDFTDIDGLLAQATSYSFPSGHATAAVYVYGFLWLLIRRGRPAPVLGRVGGVLLLGAMLAVMASRMLLGVHYASDILGGALCGGMVLALVSPAVTSRT